MFNQLATFTGFLIGKMAKNIWKIPIISPRIHSTCQKVKKAKYQYPQHTKTKSKNPAQTGFFSI